MKVKNLLLAGVLGIVFSAGMVSCDDDDLEKIFNPNEPTELRLKSKIEGEIRNDFIYNEQNQLVTKNEIINGEYGNKLNFTWENNSVSRNEHSNTRTEFVENGRIVKCVVEKILLGEKYTKTSYYTYDASGRLIRSEYDNENDKEIIELEWSGNKLIKMTDYVKSGLMELTETSEYFYSGNRMKGANQIFFKAENLSIVAKSNPELIGIVTEEMPDGIVITLNHEINFGESLPGAGDVIISKLERSMIVLDVEASEDGYIKHIEQNGELNGLTNVTYIDENEDGKVSEDEKNVKEEYNRKFHNEIDFEWERRDMK